MSYDPRILEKVRAVFTERREQTDARTVRRKADLYAACPRLEEIDGALRVLGVDLARSVFDVEREKKQKGIRERSAALNAEKKRLLKAMNCSENSLSARGECELCGDTGYKADGSTCECFKIEYARLQLEELNNKIRVYEHTFEAFDLRLFSPVRDETRSKSPRDHIRSNMELCKKYAQTFCLGSESLFFQGGGGTGKTYLATAIASQAAKRGSSVAYESAFALFSRFEEKHFGREDENTRGELASYIDDDLLIIDDLGCEMTTAFSNASLYYLLNTRFAAGRPTIVITGLAAGELADRYTPQIISRLEGDFTGVIFFGDDVRKQLRYGK